MNDYDDSSDDEVAYVDHHTLTNPGEQLLAATVNGDLPFVQELLDQSPTLLTYKDADGYTVLHRACYSRNAAILSLCLERIKAADQNLINAVTNDGWTPLHSASQWNSYECVQLLLHNDAKINVQSNGGNTPLHLAAEFGQSQETLELLLSEPNIDTSAVNSSGDTAYQIAQRKGKYAYLFEQRSNQQ